MQNERRPPLRGGAFAPGLTFDSVVANMLHREFIVYDHKQARRPAPTPTAAAASCAPSSLNPPPPTPQAYPEYIVWFREG